MKYRVIALDIDGTLKGDCSRMSSYMLEILEACVTQGALVSVATGRTLNSALNFLEQAPIIEAVISFQGALVSFEKGKKKVWETFLTEQDISLAVELLSDWEVQIAAYAGDVVYVDKMTDWAESYGVRNAVQISQVDSITDIPQELYRILAVGAPEVIRDLEVDLKQQHGDVMYATRSLPHFCEILSIDAGKEKALDWVCSHINSSREEVLAFGNGFNDVEMLKWAGRGVAMQGGESVVFEVCDDTAMSPNQDGVALYLENLLNNKQIGV